MKFFSVLYVNARVSNFTQDKIHICAINVCEFNNQRRIFKKISFRKSNYTFLEAHCSRMPKFAKDKVKKLIFKVFIKKRAIKY